MKSAEAVRVYSEQLRDQSVYYQLPMLTGGGWDKIGTLLIDQGTHASRAIVFDRSGHLLFNRFQSIALNRFPGGRVEQDPREILGSVRHVLLEVLEEAKSRGVTIKQAGLAIQRSTVVAWDRGTGDPPYQALSWQETRNRCQLAKLRDRAEQVQEWTGLRPPWWDPELQPRFLDHNQEACRRHPEACLAGVAESILFLLRANLDEAKQARLTLHHIRASGGLAHSDRLCQGLANLTELPVLRSRQSEGTAAGMAWLALENRAFFKPLPADRFQPKNDTRIQERYRRFLAGMEDPRR